MPPPPLLHLIYLFSPICQNGNAAGGSDDQDHGPWSGTLTLRWTRWTDRQEICRCSPQMTLLRFTPFCAGRAATAAITQLYRRIQQRGRCGMGCHKGGSHRVRVLLLSQGASMGSPTRQSPPSPDQPAAGGSSRRQSVELRLGGVVPELCSKTHLSETSRKMHIPPGHGVV